FAQMMLNGGKLNGRRIFKSETVQLMTSVHTPKGMKAKRGLGWDIDSPYSSPRGNHFKIGGYGHTGWTGGSLWIDPATRTIVILMTSRTHPDGKGNVIALRREVATLAAEALRGGAFGGSNAPGVLNGADVLRQRKGILPKGAKVGLVTNHTGHDRNRRSTLDFLRTSNEVELTVLFSPEHGLYGKLDEKISDGTDAKSGLKVYSLYGKNRKPAPDQLAGLDALIFDIQDIGCRFYTYISTMGLAMEAASEAGVKFIVLDRVNPIGTTVAGPVRLGPSQFIAYHDIPVQHGMTAGELARMINAERDLGVELQIVKIEGWKRSQWFDATGQPWTNPSPNMRNLTQALLYPGVGLLETAMSVGRGTDTPFEVIGAPYIDDVKLANRLNALGQAGVRFVPIRFTPGASIHADEPCGGVNIIITDRRNLRAVPLGIDIARVLHELYPKKFPLAKVGRLLCHPPTLEALGQGNTLAQIEALWKTDLANFTPRRAKHLLYE
ncbi:MAG: exo-beta-N-acetylmuramidase NamZ domain-containing protein, partial [Verrucomicrobiia bacterium]